MVNGVLVDSLGDCVNDMGDGKLTADERDEMTTSRSEENIVKLSKVKDEEGMNDQYFGLKKRFAIQCAKGFKGHCVMRDANASAIWTRCV
ncbi:hypothetical protein Tco_0477843 [Tanacetum coccineum]